MSLLRPILLHALTSPRRTAVIDDRRSYSYGQIAGGAMFVAGEIENATAERHVGIMLPTSGAFPLALLGSWLARRVAVSLNYLLSADELAYVIQDSDIDTIITAQPMIDFLGGVEKFPAGVRLLRMEQMDFHGIPPLRWPPRYADDELAVLLYTSGTSARPKGVMLTHGNLRRNVEAAIEHARITHADTFLGVLPQFHSFGLTGLTLLPLRVGSKVVYTARFIPKRLVSLIREHRPEVFMAVPSMYNAMLGVKEAGLDDFKSVRLAISGGEALPQAVFDEYQRRFNLRLLEGYGLTETSPIANWCTPDFNRVHSVGTPLPGVTQVVVDEQERVLGTNQDGEILIAGPNIMKGYYKLDDATAAVFVTVDVPQPGGGTRPLRMFRTGDIGRIDEQGFLYITGRKKEMFKVAGEIVVPREVEEVLNLHPMVKDSAVISKHDPARGEVPIAFVEVQEGQTFNEKTLLGWCREKLAAYKIPKEIRVIDVLPRNPTGKVMRRLLKAD